MQRNPKKYNKKYKNEKKRIIQTIVWEDFLNFLALLL